MPSVVDDDGQTALHHAAAEGHTDAVLILAPDQTCAELFVCDKYEMTPFHLACENGHSESVAHLLAQLEQTEDEERVKRVEQMRRGSALFLAQQGGHTSIVGMMNGSTPNHRSARLQAPCHPWPTRRPRPPHAPASPPP